MYTMTQGSFSSFISFVYGMDVVFFRSCYDYPSLSIFNQDGTLWGIAFSIDWILNALVNSDILTAINLWIRNHGFILSNSNNIVLNDGNDSIRNMLSSKIINPMLVVWISDSMLIIINALKRQLFNLLVKLIQIMTLLPDLYNDFKIYIHSFLDISVILQTLFDVLKLNSKILITKLTINYQNEDMMNGQVNLLSYYVTNDTGILLNSIISTNLIYILNKVIQMVLNIFKNIANIHIHISQITVNHVLVVNDIDAIIVIHLFEYHDNVLDHGDVNGLIQFTTRRLLLNLSSNIIEILISSGIDITIIQTGETGDNNYYMIKRVTYETKIYNHQNSYSFGINNVTRLTDGINDIYYTKFEFFFTK